MSQRKSKKDEQEVEVFDTFEVTEEDPSLSPVSLNSHFNSWLETTEVQPEEIRVVLYKMSGRGSSKNRTFCASYDDEIPEPEEIGRRFGAGKYKISVAFPGIKNSKNKVYTVTLHDSFDRMGYDNDPIRQQQLLQLQQQQSINSPENIMNMMTQVMGMVQGIMTPMMKAQSAKNAYDPSAMMGEMVNGLIPTFSKLFEGQVEMASNLAKKQLNIPLNNSEDKEEDEGNFIKNVMETIQQLAPMLQQQSGVQQQMAIKMIQNSQEYKTLKSNSVLLGSLVKELKETMGIEKVSELLEKVGLNNASA